MDGTKIYIGFSKPNIFKVGASLISWWLDKPYSHTFLIFEYPDSRPAVFHAAHGTVHFQSVENFLKSNIIIKEYAIEVTPKQQSEFFDDCMSLASEPYSFTELAQIFFADLAYRLFSHDIMPKELPGYICSELVGKFCIDRLGIKFDKPTYMLKPNDIDEKLNEKYPPAPIIVLY